MSKILTAEQRQNLEKHMPPHWNKWAYRRVIRVRMKGAFYFTGQVLKIKHFGTFGAFDYKNRWVDYYDVGKELKPSFWVKLWFHLTKWI